MSRDNIVTATTMSFAEVYAQRDKKSWQSSYWWKIEQTCHTLEPWLVAVGSSDHVLLKILLDENRLPKNQHLSWLLPALQIDNPEILEQATRVVPSIWFQAFNILADDDVKKIKMVLTLIKHDNYVLTKFLVNNFELPFSIILDCTVEYIDATMDRIYKAFDYLPLEWYLALGNGLYRYKEQNKWQMRASELHLWEEKLSYLANKYRNLTKEVITL